MKIRWLKIFRIKYLVILLILATAIIIFLNPDYIYDQEDFFKLELVEIIDAQSIQKLKNNLFFDYIVLRNMRNLTWFNFFNHESGKMNQKEYEFSTRSILGDKYSNFYYDDDLNRIYLIDYPDSNTYALLTIDDEMLQTTNHDFFVHESFNDVQKEYYLANGIKFYHYKVVDQAQKTVFENYKDGFRILFSETFSSQLTNNNQSKINDDLEKLAADFSKHFKRHFTIQDIKNILLQARSYDHFKNVAFYNKDNYKYGFVSAEILGKLDCNGDGQKDLLISLNGHRFVYAKLISLDLNTYQPIWVKDLIPDLQIDKITITDLDQDQAEEIMISYYSPCFELPVGHENDNIFGSVRRARFLVLDNQGEIKTVNGKPLAVESEPGFYDFYHYYSVPDKKVLLGMKAQYDNSSKKMLSYDLNSNSIDTLNIAYNYILDIRQEAQNIVVFDRENDLLKRLILSKDFELIREDEVHIPMEIGYIFRERFKIGKNYYYIVKTHEGTILIDSDFKKIHELNFRIKKEPVRIGSDYYFIKELNSRLTLNRLTISRNKAINPDFLIVILLELVILLLYLLLNQLLKLPLSSPQKNYFILYNLLGKLYYCSLRGKITKNYSLPKNVTRKQEHAEQMMSEISDKSHLIYKKNLYIFKYFIYELRSQDELEIIKRISHDLKNDLLLHQILLNELNEKAIDSTLKKKLSVSLGTLSASTYTLSNFSHIDKLYLESVELNQFIADLLMEYFDHQAFNNIKNNLISKSIMIQLDVKLMTIALKNLLNNALEAIRSEQYVLISNEIVADTLLLKIENPMNCPTDKINKFMDIGFSTKESGSGLGLAIARVIIERHDGELLYNVIDGNFVVTLKLNLINHEHYN